MGLLDRHQLRPTTAPPPSQDDVLTLLRSVIDPELGADIVTLGMVPGVAVTDDGVVTVGVKLTIGGCPLRAQIKKDVETRVAVHPGVADVRIDWGEMNSDPTRRSRSQRESWPSPAARVASGSRR
jgi:ATP-binding protein involved in chromosome partitioning